MNEISKRLKEARIAKGLSLEDLSAATRINVKFLAEIESGEESSLPKVYRRTFIRSCAKELGLDPVELFELEAPETEELPDEPRETEFSFEPPVEKSVVSPVLKNPFAERSQVRTMAIVVIFLLTALFLSIQWLGSDDPESGQSTADTPVAVVQRPDLTAFPRGSGGDDPAAPRFTDSLILRATTTESVWVQIVLDNVSNVEYTLPPNYTITLKAKENFLLTVGNPAGLKITLNGRRLDVLGDGNRPKKDIFLSRKLLTD
jgi:transcriptional regulator with XRE-family HTH domain